MDRTHVGSLPLLHIVVLFQAVWASVEPPTNVTLECHNLHNVLKWSYGQFLPGLKFRVDIGSTQELNGSPKNLTVYPPARQADVSFLSDSNNDYFLQVTAVIGDNESESVPSEGIEFSYFKDSLAKQKCSLDLPPVNVTAQRDAKILFRFMHPWLLYYKNSHVTGKKQKRNNHSPQIGNIPAFEYIVTMDEKSHGFICEESVCQQTLPVDAKQENHCLTITGDLNKIRVVSTKSYCTPPFKEMTLSYTKLYIALSLTAVGVTVAFVLLMVYLKLIKPSSQFPFLVKPLPNTHQPLRLDKDDIREVEATTPTQPLVQESKKEDVDEIQFTTVSPDPYDSRPPIEIIDEDEIDRGQQNNEGSGYMAGVDMEEDDAQDSHEVSSGYEGRNPVIQSLGPDDRVEGYRG